MISLFIMYRVVAGQQWVIETKMQVFDTVLQLGPSRQLIDDGHAVGSGQSRICIDGVIDGYPVELVPQPFGHH